MTSLHSFNVPIPRFQFFHPSLKLLYPDLSHSTLVMETLSIQILSFTAAALTLTTFVTVAYSFWSRPRVASRTPPIIPQSVPYIGHLIGLLKHGFEYFEHLGFESNPRGMAVADNMIGSSTSIPSSRCKYSAKMSTLSILQN